MTDVDIYKRIAKLIKDKNLPENPVEFQRLIYDFSEEQELIGPLVGKINYNVIEGYNELDLLLHDYCSPCKLEDSCNWNKEVRRAAGENYPFWLSIWPIVEFPLYKDELHFLNGRTVMCTHYQSEEFKKKGIEKVQQPITRLTQIIEEKVI